MKYIFLFINIFILLKCKTEVNEDLIITFGRSISQSVGSESQFLYFESTYGDDNNTFDDSDIEKNTNFEIKTSSTSSGNQYFLNCRLWRNQPKNILAFCKFQKDLKEKETVAFEDEVSLQYKDNNIKLIFKIEEMTISVLNSKFPFIYSRQKRIDITQEKKDYVLSFDAEVYNNEPLILDGQSSKIKNKLALENCKFQSKTINCIIDKNELDIIAKKEMEFQLCIIHDEIGYFSASLVGHVFINYPNVQQEDIYFDLVNIVYNNVEEYSSVTFETNITNIDKIRTESIQYIKIEEYKKLNCYFIKHDKLYLKLYIRKGRRIYN